MKFDDKQGLFVARRCKKNATQRSLLARLGHISLCVTNGKCEIACIEVLTLSFPQKLPVPFGYKFFLSPMLLTFMVFKRCDVRLLPRLQTPYQSFLV